MTIQKPDQEKRGRKPMPETLRRQKRTIYVTNEEFQKVKSMLEEERRDKR